MDTTVFKECERIKSSEVEASERMGAVDIKRNLDFHSRDLKIFAFINIIQVKKEKLYDILRGKEN